MLQEGRVRGLKGIRGGGVVIVRLRDREREMNAFWYKISSSC